MIELVVDPAIRLWVFLPIVIITFLLGILRHYISILLTDPRKPQLIQVQDSQALLRSQLLRENGKYLTPASFAMRKHYFNGKFSGYFVTQQRKLLEKTTAISLLNLLKANFINMIPMIVVGGWINWMFTGFVAAKVPFPLTLRYKDMLQRGIELVALNPSWVSSVSWYFLNVFGLRSVYTLVLGENNHAGDQPQEQEDAIHEAAVIVSRDTASDFKEEWELLEITDHTNALQYACSDLIE